MNSDQFSSSELWKSLESGTFSDISGIDLNSFRAPGGINNRLASWDPVDADSYRYYLNVLYNLVSSMPDKFFEIYEKIGMTSLGNPLSVRSRGLKLNLDYVFSCQEILFNLDFLKNQKNVCEIGGGFGRTCHAILRNFPNLESYVIIDLPSCLNLSQRYLAKVLSESEFSKVRFIENTDAEQVERADFFINVDSMAEMHESVVLNYLDLINQEGSYFYSRNPVCKYSPERIGLSVKVTEEYEGALRSGLCRDVVDIFDDDALNTARNFYLNRYKPSDSWEVKKDEPSLPWQYYHHVLFQKKDITE